MLNILGAMLWVASIDRLPRSWARGPSDHRLRLRLGRARLHRLGRGRSIATMVGDSVAENSPCWLMAPWSEFPRGIARPGWARWRCQSGRRRSARLRRADT